MGELRGKQTEKNLVTAFTRESQTRNRYEFFAKQAEKEGYVQICRAFETIAEQERSHAKTFFKFLEGGEVEILASFTAGRMGTTAENLAESLKGERQEQAELYPSMAKVADDEGFPLIAAKLRTIAVAECNHEQQFEALLHKLELGFFRREEKVIWECLKCGFPYVGNEPPIRCPACDHPQSWFATRS